MFQHKHEKRVKQADISQTERRSLGVANGCIGKRIVVGIFFSSFYQLPDKLGVLFTGVNRVGYVFF